MAALRVRYLYETSFFDAASNQPSEALDQVDYAINHPILQRIVNVQRRNSNISREPAPTKVTSQQQRDDDESVRQHHRSSFSSLEASVSSLEEEEYDDISAGEKQQCNNNKTMILLNRSRSLQHRQSGAFSLHLSPMQRTRISESVLSPISDKSENDANQDPCPISAAFAGPTTAAPASANATATTLLLPSLPVQRRRPHLAPLTFAKQHELTLNGSDSGISISANSLETSSEALPVRCPLVRNGTTTATALSSNSHEGLSASSVDSNELPFLMPKLKRSPGILQTLGPAFQATGRPLSLTLPFPAAAGPAGLASVAGSPNADKDLLADDTVPLEKQSWYHGSITRQDAENRLKPAPAGAFLVRDSLASHRDYFLAARSENGFLHVRIDSQWNETDKLDFALCTLPERRFSSVAAIVNHCANVGIYCRNFPPLVLKYPLAEEAF